MLQTALLLDQKPEKHLDSKLATHLEKNNITFQTLPEVRKSCFSQVLSFQKLLYVAQNVYLPQCYNNHLWDKKSAIFMPCKDHKSGVLDPKPAWDSLIALSTAFNLEQPQSRMAFSLLFTCPCLPMAAKADAHNQAAKVTISASYESSTVSRSRNRRH